MNLPPIECAPNLPIVFLGCLIGQGTAYLLEQHRMLNVARAVDLHAKARRPPREW